MSSAENPENTEKIEIMPKASASAKEKRVLTESQLQVLKMAGEKAMEKRKHLDDIKRKEKQLKEDKLSERIEKIALEEGKLKKNQCACARLRQKESEKS